MEIAVAVAATTECVIIPVVAVRFIVCIGRIVVIMIIISGPEPRTKSQALNPEG